MPAPELIRASIYGVGSSSKISGPEFARLSAAVGTAVSSWAVVPSNVVLSGVATGAAGTGTVSGTLIFTPNVAAFTGALAGFTGPTGLAMGQAICLGLAGALNTSCAYLGTSAGVGTGTDLSRVVFSNTVGLQATLTSALAAQQFSGPVALQLAQQLAPAIAALFLTGVSRGPGIVTGIGIGPPTTGVTTSGII